MSHDLDLFVQNPLSLGKFLDERWQLYMVVDRVEK